MHAHRRRRCLPQGRGEPDAGQGLGCQLWPRRPPHRYEARRRALGNAWLSAMQRHEYAQAGVILRNINSRDLTPDLQARLKELMMTPELQPNAVVTAGVKAPAQAVNSLPGAGVSRASDNRDSEFARQT